MANEIPIFKPEANQATLAGLESPKSVDEITANVRQEYAAPGDIAQPTEPTRKKRSDAGRPRGPRKTLANGPGQNQALAGAESGQAIGYTIDKAIVEKTAKTILGTVDGIVTRKIGNTVVQLTKDVELAKEMASQGGLTVAEVDLMSELTGIVFEKHGLLTGYAPEILLGIMVTAYGVRVTLVLGRLDKMVKDIKAKSKQENVSSSPPAESRNNREIGQR